MPGSYDMTIADLAEAGCPVICCIQDYEQAPADIANEDSGHYVVVTGADENTVNLQDPSAGPVEMPAVDFLSRWEDRDEVGEFIHYGIKVTPGSPGKGADEDCVSRKIPILINEGYSQEQAEAIAFHMCGEKGKAQEPCKCAEKAVTKAIQKKSPKALVDALQGFFARQKEAVLGHVKGLDEASFKAGPLVHGWLDLEHWDHVFTTEMMPTVLLYYEDAGRKTVSRIGGSHDFWATVQPNLEEAVKQQVFAFANSTNQTTSMELGQAIEMLKKE